MKKILAVALSVFVLMAHAAVAQQYVYPIYSQNNTPIVQTYVQPYGQPAYVATTAYTTNAPTSIPLSGPAPAPRYADMGNGAPFSGSANSAAPVYAAPAYTMQNSYAPVPVTSATAAPRLMMASHNWTGCYAGLYAGGAFGQQMNAGELLSQGGAFTPGTAYNGTNASYNYGMGDGFAGGGTLGCNYEIRQRWGAVTGYVLGLEGEFGSLSLSGSGIDPNSGPVDRDTNDKTTLGAWDGIVAGRFGVAFDRTLLYGKAGAVFTEAKSTIVDSCTTAPCGTGTIGASGNNQIANAAVGAGVEYALTDAWSIKGEYMYLDTSGNYSVCGAGGGSAAGSNFCSNHDLNGTHMVKVGLNYHFDGLFDGRGGNAPRW